MYIITFFQCLLYLLIGDASPSTIVELFLDALPIGLKETIGFGGSSPARSWHECINDRFIFDKLLTYFANLSKGKGGNVNVDVEAHAFVDFESR